MSVVITGSRGQLGSELCKLIENSICASHSDLDLCDFQKTKTFLKELKPSILINCAAWTAVDKAEDYLKECFATNVDSVVNLSDICNQINCFFVNISSDYVFGKDLNRKTPYKESEATGPLSVYGESKEKGEIATKVCNKHLIIRTCGLYANSVDGPIKGKNFLDTMLVMSRNDKEISIVNDQYCTPSYVPHVAKGIIDLISNQCTGTFNVVNKGDTNWFEFAKEMFDKINFDKIKPIKSEEYITKARRPKYSVLCQEKFEQNVTPMPDWRQGISDYLSKYKYIN